MTPYDPDPLDIIEWHRGAQDRRRSRLPQLLAATALALFFLGLALGHVTARASRATVIPASSFHDVTTRTMQNGGNDEQDAAGNEGSAGSPLAGRGQAGRGLRSSPTAVDLAVDRQVAPRTGAADRLVIDPAPSRTPVPRASVESPAAAPLTVSKATPAAASGGSGAWNVSGASWYGPGFYGHRTACGQTLTEGLQGTAHKTLPCGTLVTFHTAAGTVTVPVVDRGPYIAGRTWDLTGATCLALAHCWTGPIEWRL